jgi:hypothetical protein
MKTLYFASDMPGTLGQSDLFKVSTKMAPMVKPTNLGLKLTLRAERHFLSE